ncbi:Di-haem cytochrome c peroxidase [Shewanella denitrificans OS217]|jgi:cytochrome c peroxidase|uniref:Di-haem cytochrome c peroxidase n=1 Tax=Shewanella denitrificans (strain OS217 / ATCC BAA-1090 / DSM 15013) TaxID=318161 RepID=Q12TC4_SHEDO|nr:MbnH family di-heme enzyme [Shewanella denitrificans]ABE53302.1 Di-haem cytochrome c peroxidase [Shewanella denitrificans OS217]
MPFKSQKSRLGTLSICLLVITSLAACDQAATVVKHDAYQWSIPAGFPKPTVPQDNPMSTAKVSLGRYLFYDKNLSMDQSQSCASCHLQSQAFAEKLVVSIGSTGEHHRRNAPALVNIAYNKTLTWAHDGLTELEQQILLPLFGEQPIELGAGGNEAQILSRLQQGPYPKLLQDAFPEHQGPMNFVHVTQALASFVRSLISLNSPFDDYAYRGQDSALSETQLAGMGLFFSEKFECHHCHGGFNFTQSTSHEKQPLDRRPFHNTGLYYTKRIGLTTTKEVSIHYGYPEIDRGLAEVSTNPKDDGRFRAPSLRNISLTAPYMHDGSVATLAEVIDIYAAGGRNVTTGEHQGDGRNNPLKSPFIKGFDISEQEKIQLLAFLESLTDSDFITAPPLSDPWPEAEK